MILWRSKPQDPTRQLTTGALVIVLQSSESELQSKLDLPRRRHRVQDSAGTAIRVCACLTRRASYTIRVCEGQQGSPVRRVGHAEVRMVEDVEHLGAEVQRLPFRQCKLFEKGKIAVHEFRPN